jgi:hypothetical protein
MKEQRELQTMIDQLDKIIVEQDNLIEKFEQDAINYKRDALRYRWLNRYTSQLFMVTEQQMNEEVDRAMSGVAK